MSFFSRLTDIVTCNLTQVLSEESDPELAIGQIIGEIEDGLAGAERSVNTASASVERLRRELVEYTERIEHWDHQARQWVRKGDERQARLSLICRHEVEDLVAGLSQQLEAAEATREHMTTTLKALQARLAEAKRKKEQLEAGKPPDAPDDTPSEGGPVDALRAQRVEDDLEALKRELAEPAQ